MMKNLYSNLWRILVAGFLLVACTEDKGNYDRPVLREGKQSLRRRISLIKQGKALYDVVPSLFIIF